MTFSEDNNDFLQDNSIAVVGMAGRFPKSRTLDEFWRNLRDGVECISFFSTEEMKEAGLDPSLIASPDFVNARGILADPDHFDAAFFGYSPKEAELTDPQHRLFLESAWEALEDAGYDPERVAGLIGVYAGCDMNSYALNTLMFSGAGLQGLIGNDKDYLATRVCFKLNLRGPGITVQTACSSSLVAVHMACQGLLSYQCDLALAGGVGVAFPQKAGYLYQEGSILSPDGHCRPFDAGAQGTVGGDGVGVVLLKRLAEALRDGDHIHAVIKGSAVNNDGAMKVGFTAPGVAGQVSVVSMALAAADVEPGSITYVEAHGTSTPLGDPIEITALNEVFRDRCPPGHRCAIGSLKANVGHMNSAAGIGSLIKTILALKQRQIPPSINYATSNPRIDFGDGPFYVNAAVQDWTSGPQPRRAGVSSFGIGGTNAHMILEEAPVPAPEMRAAGRDWQLLILSAQSAAALDQSCERLADHLTDHPNLPLADVAHTLQSGRRLLRHRRWLVCRSAADAVRRLRNGGSEVASTLTGDQDSGGVAFLFPGQGAQHLEMGRDLYRYEPLFRAEVDRCSELLQPIIGRDIRSILYPDEAGRDEAAALLDQTEFTQPLLFVVEYALVRLWAAWGVRPQVMLGHSLGEYTAACLAGVFPLADALRLVAARGRLMQGMEAGAMLSVLLPERALLDRWPAVSIAAVNSPTQCVLSGRTEAIAAIERQLAAEGVECQRLATSHAFHSDMMDPMLGAFRAVVSGVRLSPPQIPVISNVTGLPLSAAEATSVDYWVDHVRRPVRFSDGIADLLRDPNRILLEVGPGRTLAALAARQASKSRTLLNSLPHRRDDTPDQAHILGTLGQLYCRGVAVDWEAMHGGEERRRVPLPTYPFERQRYHRSWKVPAQSTPIAGKNPDIGAWLYLPGWKSAPATGSPVAVENGACWLILMEGWGFGQEVTVRARAEGATVIQVEAGPGFAQLAADRYCVDPADPQALVKLFEVLKNAGQWPARVVHLWNLRTKVAPSDAEDLGVLDLLPFVQAIAGAKEHGPVQLDVVTSRVFDVTGEEPLCPERATLLGPAQVASQEYPGVRCRVIDIQPPADPASREPVHQALWDELAAPPPSPGAMPWVALRGSRRWLPSFEPAPDNGPQPSPIRSGGTYLITGGLGTIGLALADWLARSGAANLVLTSRNGLPPEGERDAWLSAHGPNDPTSRRIRGVCALEAIGATVLVVDADVADTVRMQQVVAQIGSRFGRLHGVVHCAGLVGEEDLLRSIRDTGASQIETHGRPKIDGVRVLQQVLPADLDFCVLCSSLSTVLGGVGFAAYAAANHFLDAFAEDHDRRSPYPWISIDWDGWMAPSNAADNPAALLGGFALSPREGVQVVARILGQCVGHRRRPSRWVVSTGDLQARLAHVPAPRARGAGSAAPSRTAGKANSRPDLDTPFVAPRDEREETIAVAWREVLGFDRVGVHDNFFRLGGDSLAAIQLGSRLRETFQVELSIHNLFDEPTVAALAVRIGKALQENASTPDDLLSKLALIENMSDEEVERMLAEMEATGNG